MGCVCWNQFSNLRYRSVYALSSICAQLELAVRLRLGLHDLEAGEQCVARQNATVGCHQHPVDVHLAERRQ
jgi:hypothetical protein